MILITTFSFFYYLHGLRLHESCHLNDQARINFLIASDASDYKDRLRTKIINRYEDYCNIKVINISNLKNNVSELFDIILIMDTCVACDDFNRSLKKFLVEDQNLNKVVLLMTAGDSQQGFNYAGIDAISAASRTDNIANDYLRIISEIESKLKKVELNDMSLIR